MQYRFEKLGYGPEVKFEVEVIETQKGKFRVVRVTLRPGKFKAYLGHQAKLARVYRNKEEALGPLWSVA
jgi:hypothetical protein